MNRRVFAIVAISVLLACTGSAFAKAGEYPNDEKIGLSEGWPKDLQALVNSRNRVYGQWFQTTATLYYSGDTKDFNTFLKQYSEVDLPGHSLVINPFQGTVKSIMHEGKTIGFDWSVHVYERWSSGPDHKRLPQAVDIAVFTGNVQHSKIVAPKNVVVQKATPKVNMGDLHPAFAIYLLADDKINARDAFEKKIGDLVLQERPLFTIDDISSYQWNDHTLTLKPGVVERVPKVRNVFGLPFVVMSGGQSLYVGGFWTYISSYLPYAPIIYADPPLKDKNDLRIELPIRDGKPDPRSDPAIKSAFEKAGKLR